MPHEQHEAIYPAALAGAVIVLALVLTQFVFPRFLQNFAQSGVELPLPTQILLQIDSGFRPHKEH